jgi:GNAT superfamily N-acetyltransferase
VKLRVGTAADIDFVLAVEADPVVGRWIDAAPRARHSQVVDDPDLTHLIAVARGRDVGFLLMAGLTNPHASIELRRIAMAERGAGHGSAALAAVADWAFGERGAHRLWLDAHVDNAVARGAYRRAGFSEEGVMRDALRVGDGWASLVLMSQLRDEWAERSRPAT